MWFVEVLDIVHTVSDLEMTLRRLWCRVCLVHTVSDLEMTLRRLW